ncbi:hypothetical protein [Leifsonia shinshuensis]|uniref:hypothetical protein n=1 Tax=Leifsonia shinshuensis TaxID=150026 RepID=UPI002863A9DE|nr:hypothetical protein [Leifsonia shinshuensis]MDR6969785.1 hypothetical protein [Leifsonia shinshuensis]
MDYTKNTSVRKSSAFTAKRAVVGAASLLTATALVGVGAQGAFATTVDGGASGSGSASSSSAQATAQAHVSADAGHDLFTGHLSGAKAQALAKRIVADKPLFALLPDALQRDVTALATASAQDRTADAKAIVHTALTGGYGSAVKDLATRLKDARGDRTAASGLTDLVQELRSGDLSSPQLGDTGATVAADVTADAQLAAKLPAALRSDLTQLASAPAAERTPDVQKIAATAVAGGYGADLQQLAQQVEQEIASGR